MSKHFRGLGFYLIVIIVIMVALTLTNNITNQKADEYTYSQFIKDIKGNVNKSKNVDKIKRVQILQDESVPSGHIVVYYDDKVGTVEKLAVTDVSKVEAEIRELGFEQYFVEEVKSGGLGDIIIWLLIGLAAILLITMLTSRAAGGGAAGGGNSKVMNFGKSRAKLNTDLTDVNFDKVAGLKEEKEELEEIVDFLKEPQKYIEVGARIPKGVLLEGPPGTGKTLLAKAVAGEAGVPFFSISGSDFVEMFVGVGASRVRDLFEDGKKNAPCIIFIDEIDAVARKRGSGLGGGHDEREQTLNQLLVEMDGFGANEGIIVMAATNRVDILDPAILRPGRFDRKVMVGAPDVKGREEILEVHAKNKPLAEDVVLKDVARTTSGFTGADLENLLNEAAIKAAKEDRAYITEEDIKKSFIKVGIGAEKKSRVVSEKEKRITAIHEAGHAILFHVLPDAPPVYTVSIIPTGKGAAGYTMPLPGKDEMFNTKKKMIQDIMVSLGGRIAEEITFDDVTTGASQDIKVATANAHAMVTRYGFSEELGLVNYDDDNEVFIGRDFGQKQGYSEEIAAKIDNEVKNIINKCYEDAKDIIVKHQDILNACADLLMEKERITREEFEGLFPKEEA